MDASSFYFNLLFLYRTEMERMRAAYSAFVRELFAIAMNTTMRIRFGGTASAGVVTD
jgi:hypothetical protein